MSNFLITTIASDIHTQINNLVSNGNYIYNNLPHIRVDVASNYYIIGSEITTLDENNLKEYLKKLLFISFYNVSEF